MDQLDLLRTLLKRDHALRLVERDIYSLLDERSRHSEYDGKSWLYDRVVGNGLYNRIMWGSTPEHYRIFAHEAVQSRSGGWILDAGCGSLLFTAEAYAQSERPVVACDRSLGMLLQARDRLAKQKGDVGSRVIFLQVDLDEMPFLANSFETVLSMNFIHHQEDSALTIENFRSVLTKTGVVYLTTLVQSGRLIGGLYLDCLHGLGWIAKPRQSETIRSDVRNQMEMRSFGPKATWPTFRRPLHNEDDRHKSFSQSLAAGQLVFCCAGSSDSVYVSWASSLPCS
ncbi:MAG TPA: class I SAM-dependent methyltransferase [Pyrinomonadaceae bacterium]|nr:class I SAM-dependent methyltransferase [Pyrinomonadaceae bacterium]